MRHERWLLSVAVLLAWAGSGCEKQVREAKTPAGSDAATQVADVAPMQSGDATVAAATVPAKPETQPALAFLSIDGISAEFPPTRLTLYPGDGAVRSELCSDLPKSALRKYDGNELYLEMQLEDLSADGVVDGVSWRFKSSHSGKAHSPNGIFLNGQGTHLQPFDVLVRFERRNDVLYAQIMGQFRAYEDGVPEGAAPFVGVRGELPVELVHKR